MAVEKAVESAVEKDVTKADSKAASTAQRKVACWAVLMVDVWVELTDPLRAE